MSSSRTQKNLQQELDDNDFELSQAQYLEMVEEIKKLRAYIQGQASQNNEVEKLKAEVKTLRSAANIVNTPVKPKESIKLANPTPYDGSPGQLQAYLTQVRAYQRFHGLDNQSDGERVMHAASFLKGRALAWFEPYLTDFLEKDEFEQCKQETQDIFSNFKNYELALRSLFQDPDEERQAERELMRLRQKGPATTYAAEFRRICARVDYTDTTKIFMFYNGLKDEVKDELSKLDRPDDFIQYVELAIRIDNRIYERKLEKKGQDPTRPFRQQNKPNSGKRYQPRTTASGQHSGPMELDAAQKKPRKDVECYNCGKKGHFARDCRSKKKDDWKPVPEQRQANLATKEPAENHASTSWTACYNDNCNTHLSSKEASGWFPKAPKGQKTLAVAERKPLAIAVGTNQVAPLDLKDWNPHEQVGKAPPVAPDTSITRIAIPGRDRSAVTSAVREGLPALPPARFPNDDPRMHHQHLNHKEISWASCIFDRCGIHYASKIKEDFFPERLGMMEMARLYEQKELQYWSIQQYSPGQGYAILELRTDYPLHCLRNPGPWRHCLQTSCQIHLKLKLQDWHRRCQPDVVSPLNKEDMTPKDLTTAAQALRAAKGLTQGAIQRIEKILVEDQMTKNDQGRV
ncbi:Retrotransposon-derived protein PEG10 [Diaporthe amygdali]|uniref:Retrotransposon-derived protein PEG10 n=1 Tax=Phomopsis amygdali TaxID=1214568 RepID=UPI0022FE4FFC|nr:Retrotransposon-derived protein PEG10 [Diaporthe amygdali]KAJ0100660.1 Retrotransposon-derived protein PEG10 [Diaporthe amygdali]